MDVYHIAEESPETLTVWQENGWFTGISYHTAEETGIYLHILNGALTLVMSGAVGTSFKRILFSLHHVVISLQFEL